MTKALKRYLRRRKKTPVAAYRPARKKRVPTPPSTVEASPAQPPVESLKPARKSITVFFRGILSCAKYVLPLFLSMYLAAYAITWAQYEFAFNRQRQQLSIIGAMMAAGKAKDFAPLLAELTRRKLPERPTLWDWEYIVFTAFNEEEPVKFSDYNQALMDDVAGLIRRIDDWTHADLSGIVLSKVNLSDADLRDANLRDSNLSGANLVQAKLSGANLFGVNLTKAYIRSADLTKALLMWADLTWAKLENADLRQAKLTGVKLQEADLAEVDVSKMCFFSTKIQKYALFDDSCTDDGLITAAVETLAKAKTLYKAKLPKPVKERLEKSHPHLFEKPKTENAFNVVPPQGKAPPRQP